MLTIINAEEGMVYENKQNGIISKTLILGVTDSITNYNYIPEPEPVEEIEEPEGESLSDLI